MTVLSHDDMITAMIIAAALGELARDPALTLNLYDWQSIASRLAATSPRAAKQIADAIMAQVKWNALRLVNDHQADQAAAWRRYGLLDDDSTSSQPTL